MAQIVRRLLGDDKTVRYDVRFRVDGVVRNKTFRLRGDADAYKRKVEGDELAGLIVDPRGGERAFGPYATAWIDTRLAKGRPLTPATRQGYKGLLRRHLNPAFEKAALRKITPERVRVWHSDLIKSAGPDQAAKSYRLLRAILNTAVSDRLLTQNPCTVPGAGTENTPERPLLEPQPFSTSRTPSNHGCGRSSCSRDSAPSALASCWVLSGETSTRYGAPSR